MNQEQANDSSSIMTSDTPDDILPDQLIVKIQVPSEFFPLFEKKSKGLQKNNKKKVHGSIGNKTIREWKKFKRDHQLQYQKQFPGIPDSNILFIPDSTMKDPVVFEEKSQLGKRLDVNAILNQHAENERRAVETRKRQEQLEAAVEPLVKSNYLAIDCEMVGVGEKGKQSALGRVTIVNWDHEVVLDTFVQVPEPVTDFRTWISGITAKDLSPENEKCMDLKSCRERVKQLIEDKIVVGHALKHDFKALGLTHPSFRVRDTALYRPYRKMYTVLQTNTHGKSVSRNKYGPSKLKDLAQEKLGRAIQQKGQPHSPFEDSCTVMDLYKLERDTWEKNLHKSFIHKGKRKR